MTDNSPRWPGSNGAPGLDFSPRRQPSGGGSANDAPSGAVNGQQGGVNPGDGRSARPAPPPFGPGAASSARAGSASTARTSVQTPPRSGEGSPAGSPADATRVQSAAAPSAPSSAPAPPSDATQLSPKAPAPAQPGPSKGQQAPTAKSSAAAWAWQPLGTEVAAGGAPGSTAAPVADVAAAEGAIAGAVAKGADQGRKTATRRTTPSPSSSTPSAGATRRIGSRRTRKARLRLARLDPWSVMKTTFLFSIAFGIIMIVVAWVLWTVLAGSGAFESANAFLTTLIGQEGQEFRLEDYINSGRVLGAAAVLAAIDVVILTAVATLFAFLYNLAATVIGGLEVTLAED